MSVFDVKGGPVFPSRGFTVDASGALCGETVNHEGMTLRDYFAAKAMQSLLIRGYTGEDDKTGYHYHEGEGTNSLNCGRNDLAEDAYNIADAMLAAREAKCTP